MGNGFVDKICFLKLSLWNYTGINARTRTVYDWTF